MNNFQMQKVMSNFDDMFELIFSLESIIKMTQNVCRNKEVASVYYNLPLKQKYTLSEERNHYINMLSLALNQISSLKEANTNLEKELAFLE